MLGSIDGGTSTRGGIGDSAVQGFLPAATQQAGATKARGLSTPGRLRLGVVVALLPVVGFAVAVHVGLARNADTVQTVGEDATRGITAAQALKLNLAELDTIAVEQLLAPPALDESGFPEAYNTKRIELQQNIIAAAAESPGEAYGEALANIDYALAHYHSQMGDASAAAAAGDLVAADESYDKAHAVMATTILPEADRFDRAHTYVLNDTYGRQKDRTLATTGWIVGTWTLLVGLIIAAHLVMSRKFRRILNVPLIAAIGLAVLGLALGLSGLERSADELGAARDEAFDTIHRLARARAVAVSLQQAQGDHLLNPSDQTAEVAFDDQVDQLLWDSDDGNRSAVEIATSEEFNGGEGGYLGAVVNVDVSVERRLQARTAIVELGDFLTADDEMRQTLAEGNRPGAIDAVFGEDSAFDELDQAIAVAQDSGQEVFDDHSESAKDATRALPLLNIALAGGIAVLIVAGFWPRLREYR